jgi:hypothetical protein
MSAPLTHLPPAPDTLPANRHYEGDGYTEFVAGLERQQYEAAEFDTEYRDPLREPVGYDAARIMEEEEHEEACGFCEHGMPFCPVCDC